MRGICWRVGVGGKWINAYNSKSSAIASAKKTPGAFVVREQKHEKGTDGAVVWRNMVK